MARTAQTPRNLKSTGGKRAAKWLQRSHVFADHTGRPVTTFYTSVSPSKDIMPKLSYHLYTLSPLAEDLATIGHKFLTSSPVLRVGNMRNRWPRVDIYSPLGSVEECMKHHLREKEFRKESDGPHIVPNWGGRISSYPYRDPYRNAILAIDADCPDWNAIEKKGLLSVQFGLEVKPEWEVEVHKAEAEDEWEELAIEKITFGPDPWIMRAIMEKEQEEAFETKRQEQFSKGEMIANDEERLLYELLDGLNCVLIDCVYRKPYCDSCADGVEHEVCEIERYVCSISFDFEHLYFFTGIYITLTTKGIALHVQMLLLGLTKTRMTEM